MAIISGSIVAMVTPWSADDTIDEAVVRKLVEHHIANGTSGILPCGTTGESPSFTHEEQHRMIALTVEAANGRVPVIAGAGSNSTREAVSLAQAAEREGADAILTITPYYNKPTQEGLFQHFQAVREATTLPMMLYNVPSRTGVNLLPETAVRCHRELGGILGVKEATGDLSQAQDLIEAGVGVFSGEDGLTFPMLCQGALGVVSVVANFAPRLMADLCQAVADGDLTRARACQSAVHELTKLAFSETNPIPAKTAMAVLGFGEERFRLPLVPMSPARKEALVAGLRHFHLID
jgi:4-hydroxy-tetrahydrodipicolinate synthase